MGPLFNLFFGILLFFAINLIGFETESSRIHIPSSLTESGSPAYEAGLRTGDTVVSINDNKVFSFMDLQNQTLFSKGEELDITVERDGTRHTFTVKPVTYKEGGFASIGVMPYGERIAVGHVAEGSAAEKAGLQVQDEITAVNGESVRSPREFTDSMRENPGREVTLAVMRDGESLAIPVIPEEHTGIKLSGLQNDRWTADTIDLYRDGEDVFGPEIDSGSIMVNGSEPASYEEFVELITTADENENEITVSGETGTFTLQHYGFLGVAVGVVPEMIFVRYPVGTALAKSFYDPFVFVTMNLRALGMMISGKLNVRENLAGPVMIAKVAGDTMRYRGVRDYILLMAHISIILMVMNLLPIPAVDGSHIIIYVVEMIRGKQASPEIIEKIQLVGFFLIATLGLFALWNDIMRLIR